MALSNYTWDCNSYNSGSISISSYLYPFITIITKVLSLSIYIFYIYIHTSVSSHLKSMKDYNCALPITSPEESLYHHLSSSNQFLAPRNLQTAQWECWGLLIQRTPICHEWFPSCGWWFGTWLDCDFPYIGNVIIPTDFHIFQRGWNHQPLYFAWNPSFKWWWLPELKGKLKPENPNQFWLKQGFRVKVLIF